MAEQNEQDELFEEELREKRFDRELRECMNCSFFWGHNHRCELEHCYKERKLETAKEKQLSKCDGCAYRKGDYCFPCMKDLLGK